MRQLMAEEFWKVAWEPGVVELFRRARHEAAAIEDDYLGTPHLLLAAVAITPVEEHGIAKLHLEAVRAAVLAVTGPRGPDTFTLTPWPQTPRFKLAIERAMRRAFSEGRTVSRNDIRYGLLADAESECLKVLRHLEVPAEKLWAALA
jgi:hypothetical protein